jgi:hypothetical protein
MPDKPKQQSAKAVAVLNEPAIEDMTVPQLAALANQTHATIAQLYRNGLEHAKQAGQALELIKAKLGHGGWKPFLEENYKANDGNPAPSTARAYIQIHREWDRITDHGLDRFRGIEHVRRWLAGHDDEEIDPGEPDEGSKAEKKDSDAKTGSKRSGKQDKPKDLPVTLKFRDDKAKVEFSTKLDKLQGEFKTEGITATVMAAIRFSYKEKFHDE